MKPTTPVEIVLADEQTRHLRFSLGAVKRIKAKYAAAPQETESKDNYAMVIQGRILGAIGERPEETLPYLLMEGLVEKEGLTEQKILDDLITGPMLDYVSLCVVEAFFGQRLAQRLRDKTRIEDAVVQQMIDRALETVKPKPAQPEQAELPLQPSLLN